MSLLTSQLQTGLLAYSRRKNFIGLGVNFSEFENLTYDCFVSNFNSGNYSPSLLQSELNTTFENLYANNIYVRSYQITPTFNENSDYVRLIHFKVEIENRLNSSFTNQTEFNSSNYLGIAPAFWTTYGPNFNSFSENYDYSKKEDGTITTEHSLNFSILAGGQSNATTIANYVFGSDAGNAFYTSLTSTLISPAQLLAFQQNVRQYYTENYDLMKNVYSFTKHIDYPPLLSENSLNVNKNVKNSIILGEDGITTVSEEGKIKAFTDFSQAVLEYNDSVTNSIFGRCNAFYNSFSSLANISNGVLNNYPIKNDAIYNKPGLTVDYTVSFTDNPNFNLTYDTITQKTVKIDLIEDKYINIEHSYDFTRLAHVSLAQTGVMIQAIQAADAESLILISNPGTIYTNSEIYNPYLPNMNRIKESFTLPNRKRNFSANFMYSNEPVYFININGTIYPKLKYLVKDNTPDSIVNEYKIVNRPTQTSVLSYAYQDTKGQKSIEINGFLERQYGLTFTSPQNIQTQFIPLFNWGIQNLLSSFNGQNVLAMTYFLSDCKIQFNSENEFNMEIIIDYTMKKYTS